MSDPMTKSCSHGKLFSVDCNECELIWLEQRIKFHRESLKRNEEKYHALKSKMDKEGQK